MIEKDRKDLLEEQYRRSKIASMKKKTVHRVEIVIYTIEQTFDDQDKNIDEEADLQYEEDICDFDSYEKAEDFANLLREKADKYL